MRALTEALCSQPESPRKGLRIVTTGILADSPALLGILADAGCTVADDQVAQESGFFRTDTPVTADPVVGLARRLDWRRGAASSSTPARSGGGSW